MNDFNGQSNIYQKQAKIVPAPSALDKRKLEVRRRIEEIKEKRRQKKEDPFGALV